MVKTFSTKLDTKVLKLFDDFCEQHHYKKSRLLEEIITEGIQKRAESTALAESIYRGLTQEQEGELYTEEEVASEVFGKKKRLP